MRPITHLQSRTAILVDENIDTDRIIPARFLTSTERSGFGKLCFHDWRYLADGSDNPAFPLNKPEALGCSILIAGRNFGCGSSREHAAWAINQFGFLAVIAPTFADIFYSNAGKNGIILARLTEEEVETLMQRSTKNPKHLITINLEAQTVTDDQGFKATFEIDPFRKRCLLEGLDDIGLTLLHKADLNKFEAKHNKEFWLKPKASEAA